MTTPSENKQRQGLRTLPPKQDGELSLNDIFAGLNGGTYNPTTYKNSASVPSINEDGKVKRKITVGQIIAIIIIILSLFAIIYTFIVTLPYMT